MRPAILAGVVLAALPAVGLAQSGSYLAVVVDPQAKLRAGPSDQYPETGVLPRGSRVVVDHDEGNGWVAIESPQGQVSWISALFVEGFDGNRPMPQLVYVNSDSEVTLSPGRADQHEPLHSIRRIKIPNGTILTAVGQKARFAEKWWYPVAPPAGDFRYVPKSALQYDKAVTTAFNVRDAGPTIPAGGIGAPAVSGGHAPPGSPSRPPLANGSVNHPLWAQADAAENDGRYDEAEKALFELARLMNQPGGDHDTANLCFTRIHTLREKKRTGGGSIATTSPGTGNWTMPRDDRTTLLPPTRATGAGSRGLTPPGTPNTGTLTSPGSPSSDRPSWTGAGMLVKSVLVIDGRTAYALESAPGVAYAYVVAASGVDLTPYMNRKIDVFGTQTTRRDLKLPLVVATSVDVVR